MNVVDYLKNKEKNLTQSLRPEHLKKRLEPPLRELSTKMSKHLSNWDNSWMEKLSLVLDPNARDTHTMIPASRACYEYWQPLIGEEIQLGDWQTITQSMIDQFATVTGDQQWIHTDPERAASDSPFGTTIAHGFLTLSLLPKLTGMINPSNSTFARTRLVVNQGLNQVRFPYPVKTGADVRARTHLIDVVPAKKSVDLLQQISIEIKGSPRLACVAESLVRIYC